MLQIVIFYFYYIPFLFFLFSFLYFFFKIQLYIHKKLPLCWSEWTPTLCFEKNYFYTKTWNWSQFFQEMKTFHCPINSQRKKITFSLCLLLEIESVRSLSKLVFKHFLWTEKCINCIAITHVSNSLFMKEWILCRD